MRKILVLDNYDSFTYNLVHYLDDIGNFELKVVRNDKFDLDDVEEFSHIVLSPGPGIPCEAGLMPQLITRYAYQKRILGVCLGHQAIAEAFGGTLLNMSTVIHGKTSEISVLDHQESLFAGLPKRFSVGRYHSWLVRRDNLPDCLKVTAEGPNGEIMALRHCEYPVSGVQFHPESVLTPNGKKMLRNWTESL